MSNKNKSRLIKRLITGAMCLTLVFSINGFAAVVSDNDGSAFITKAEFDSLKNNFQSQIDQYNQSIDSKIDGAIAAYLAGLQLSTQQIVPWYVPDLQNKKIYNTSKKHPIDYAFGSPILYGAFMRYDDNINSTYTYNNAFYILIDKKSVDSNNKQNKTYITAMDDNELIAAWKGYYKDVVDTIFVESVTYNPTKHWANVKRPTEYANFGIRTYGAGTSDSYMAFNNSTTTLIGRSLFSLDELYYDGSGVPWNGVEVGANIKSILHEIPENPEKRYVTCFANYYYDMFSNWDADRQWGYYPMNKTTPYVRKFRNLYENEVVSWPKNNSSVSNLAECVGTITDYKSFLRGGNATSDYTIWNESKVLPVYNSYYSRNEGESCKITPVMIGFEKIDSWSKIYEAQYDTVLNHNNATAWFTKDTVLLDKNSNHHISLAAGVPTFELEKNTSFIWNIKFEDTSKDYIIWLKDEPFSKSSPELETDTLAVTGLDEVNTWHTSTRPNNHAYKVRNGAGTIKINDVTNDGVLFLKWTESVSDITAAGGGVLVCSESAKKIVSN